MRRRFTIKLLLALVSFVPDVVSFVVDHVPGPDAPAVEAEAIRDSTARFPGGCCESPKPDPGPTNG